LKLIHRPNLRLFLRIHPLDVRIFGSSNVIPFQPEELAETDASMIASKVKKALDQDKIVVQTYDSVIVIPVANIKYIQVTPPPDSLPEGILKNAEIVE